MEKAMLPVIKGDILGSLPSQHPKG